MSHLRLGFTLIELLVSIALALLLLGVATSGYMQIHALTQRIDAHLTLNRRAETLYVQLNKRLSVAEPHCALVIDPRSGILRLLFVRAKEDQNDWNWTTQSWDANTTDLYWELWEYRPAEQRLYQASSLPYWDFNMDQRLPSPVDLSGQAFRSSPQPRRTLAPTDWMGTLEQNQLFPQLPRTSPISTSRASTGDLGDWGMLQRELRIVCEGVRDLTWEAVCNDGTVHTFTAGSPATPWVVDGVWMDGRTVDGAGRQPGQPGWSYATSELPGRPRLLRLRMTLERAFRADNSKDLGKVIDRVYSFSFQLPSTSGN